MKKEEKDIPRPQTTRLASFRPVLVDATQPNPPRPFKISIKPK